jgi:uncharacterized protein (DUF2147 family)
MVRRAKRAGGQIEVAMKLHRMTAAVIWFSFTALSITSGSMALAAEPLGTWYTEGNDSQVRIANCGGALCGTLIWLKDPNDPATGKPKLDKNNADASKQSRPLLGVQIVLGMTPSGPNVWSGNVYNASDGKTYSGSFTMTGNNAAVLKGCVMSIICKSQNWTRAK